MAERKACAVEGCERQAHARGLCNMHYLRWHRSGEGSYAYGPADQRRQCAVDGCRKFVAARSLCENHYAQNKRDGRFGDIATTRSGWCKVDGCDLPSMARGYCSKHYQRWQSNGHVADPVRPSLVERLWAGFERNGPLPRHAPQLGRCWQWTRPGRRSGYGAFNQSTAHRAMYEVIFGPLDDGLTIDHLCLNRLCVNPMHLEAVTRNENSRRVWARANEHEFCPTCRRPWPAEERE